MKIVKISKTGKSKRDIIGLQTEKYKKMVDEIQQRHISLVEDPPDFLTHEEKLKMEYELSLLVK